MGNSDFFSKLNTIYLNGREQDWIQKIKNKPTDFARKQYLEQLFDSPISRVALTDVIKAWNQDAELTDEERVLAEFSLKFVNSLLASSDLPLINTDSVRLFQQLG